MGLVLKDRVLETCTAPGTGAVTLLGAVTGYQTFSSAIGNANTCYYTIADQNGANWEVGIGTYTSSGNTLTRTTVLSSSNGGATTNFTSGTQNVFVTYPSERSVNLSSSALTSGRVTYATTDGLLTDSTNFTWNGSSLGLTGTTSAVTTAITATTGAPYTSYTNTGSSFFVGKENSAGGSFGTTAYASLLYEGGAYPMVFFTNATERMRITSAGDVGIGVTPNTTNVGGTYKLLSVGTSGGSGIFMGQSDSTASGSTVAQFFGKTTGTAGYQLAGGMLVGLDGTSTTNAVGRLQFYTASGGSVTERMRIDSSGNVGIGTTSPGSTRLAIDTTAGIMTSFNSSNANGGYITVATSGTVIADLGTATNCFGSGGNDTFGINGRGARSLLFGTNNTERMRITSAGNVGIGTTSPSYPLDLSGTSGIIARFTGTSNSTGVSIYSAATSYVGDLTASNTVGFNASSNYVSLGTNGTERMRIDTSGNVGIGTSSPASILELRQSVPIITFSPTNYTNQYQTTLGTQSGADAYLIFGNNNKNEIRAGRTATGGYLDIYTNNTVSQASASDGILAMRLDPSGNVGIGTSSPTTYLGDKFVAYKSTASTTGILNIASVVGVSSGTTDSGFGSRFLLYTQNANGNQYPAGIAALNSTGGSNLTELGFYTATSGPTLTERMRIDSSGNLGVGITSVGARIQVQGAGATSATYCASFLNSGGFPLLDIRNDGLISTGSRSLSPYNNTTASVSNMYVDSSGLLYRSISSLKYKTDVQDATHGLTDVLKLRSVTYKGNNDGDTVFGGLIAEEVHEAGLTEFVQYAEDGTPDALAYGNMVSLAFKAIQEQQALIESLTTRLTALEK